jgi:hypothetical protein
MPGLTHPPWLDTFRGDDNPSFSHGHVMRTFSPSWCYSLLGLVVALVAPASNTGGSGIRSVAFPAVLETAFHGRGAVRVALPSPVVRHPRAEIYQFRLRGTSQAPGASGLGILTLAPSPFGVAVTVDGFLVYELALATDGLVFRKMSESQAHVVWMATPDLDRVEKLGVLGESGKWRGPLSGMNKFLLLVTLENSPDVEVRRGPILMRGVSPSGLLISYNNHELFSNMPHLE